MPVKWKKTWISDETFESVSVFDVNNDGVLDLVSGGFWYQGPDFRRKHTIGTVKMYDEYFDDFSTIALDINGDGYLDFITGGWWGKTLRWRENPKGDPKQQWTEHIIADVGNIETTRAWDIDGDGQIEIVPNTPPRREVKVFKLVAPGKFDCHTIYTFPENQIQGHGLGCGDIAGNGRQDIILARGWLEAPANPWRDQWIWHADFMDAPWATGTSWGFPGSVPMLVADVNGDGRNEIITGNAHGYGLWWSERRGTGWAHHPIDPYNAQYHDLQWADIDGDGQCELVTGKRHRAHCGNDAGEWDDVGMYYFKWTGEGFAKQVIDYGPIGTGKGCGIAFALADLRGNGRLDLVAPGKDGLSVFFNEGSA